MAEQTAPRMTRSVLVPPGDRGFTLALHGGAGGRVREFTPEEQAGYEGGLLAAHAAGEEVLAAGGAALDAVIAAVRVMEENPLFNAGRGAALNSVGEAELDAAVATGDGRCGSVACSRHAKSPVALARYVMEGTRHAFIVDPPEAFVAEAGCEAVDPSWFVTERRREQLAHFQEQHPDLRRAPSRHGTVGAVAVDRGGRIAAATSTGGVLGQEVGRVGDAPVIGAGTYANDATCAISCTGDGEAFLAGVVAHDVHARLRYAGQGLDEAAEATFAQEVALRNATGGLVAVLPDGTALAAFNSKMMFAAFRDESGEVVAWV